MILKKIIILQTIVCLVLTFTYVITGETSKGNIDEYKMKVMAAASRHYTLNDLWDKSREAAAYVVKAPAAVTARIISSNEKQKYGKPVDDVAEGEVASVYSVYGGQVIETGSSETIGKYIKIRHDDAVSIYGNCSRIYVKEGQHVRQGHVIAEFNTKSENEFYYYLIEE